MDRAQRASTSGNSRLRCAASCASLALALLVPGCDAALALHISPVTPRDAAGITRCVAAAHRPVTQELHIEILRAYVAIAPDEARRLYVDARASAYGAAYTRRIACTMNRAGEVLGVEGRPVQLVVRARAG